MSRSCSIERIGAQFDLYILMIVCLENFLGASRMSIGFHFGVHLEFCGTINENGNFQILTRYERNASCQFQTQYVNIKNGILK